jgi:hypothetical protein
MKLFNYQKLFGAFSDAYQLIMLDQEPSDKQERKMLDKAKTLIDAGWTRRMMALEQREQKTGEPVDFAAEREAFYPKVVDGKLAVPLQYLQEFMFQKIAALQNNTSIHNTKEVTELKEVYDEYKVALYPSFSGLAFDFINWSAKDRQKPKLLVHAKEADGEEVCIRFEAAGELCQKFMLALLHLPVQQGTVFDLKVEAVDPAIARNKAGGKVEVGKYVNHNMVLTVNGKTHSGHPPKGTKFLQKPTMEYMETLFKQAQMETEQRAAKAAA